MEKQQHMQRTFRGGRRPMTSNSGVRMVCTEDHDDLLAVPSCGKKPVGLPLHNGGYFHRETREEHQRIMAYAKGLRLRPRTNVNFFIQKLGRALHLWH